MPDNTQKTLKEIFGLKMMVKSGLEKIILKFHDGRVAAAQCKKICPERLNWPGRLAGISEGHCGLEHQNNLF